MTEYAHNYNVELRNSSGELRKYLTPWVRSVSWEWNRIGGCGRCNISLAMGYCDIKFVVGDDIQIRVKSGSTTKLVYRGWVASIVPTLKIGQEIRLDVRGYFDLLDHVVVQDTGSDKTYTSSSIGDIVDSIADTFIAANTDITKGTINSTAFSVDSITFKSSVSDALSTLAEIAGGIEYGVDENLSFFWLAERVTLRKIFRAGMDVESYEKRTDGNQLINKIYFEGGSDHRNSGQNSDSQSRYYLAEKIMMNSSITTSSVSAQFISAQLDLYSRPKTVLRIKVPNVALRLEDSLPIGKIAVSDPNSEERDNVWGTAANGGSNLLWGTTANGGSNELWGNLFSDQLYKVSYQISESEGKFHLDIQLGNSGILEAAAKLRRLEQSITDLRQRS
ncbi:MAG: hypothetical protein M0P69_04445 [Bacteroidales bacterium]|nr:hypothetical protein [Bacteroidales bacterium]